MRCGFQPRLYGGDFVFLMNPPAFQFYADDFIGGTCDLSAKDVGAYIRLICFQWSKGKIPSDRNKLARIAGTNVTLDVLSKFPDGMNQRLENERIKQEEYREKKAKSGKNGAEKRWHNHSTPIVSPLADPIANGMANDSSPSPSPLPIKNATHSKARKAKAELSDDEWMAQLKANPDHQGINIESEYAKACEWCSKNSTTLSRRRFANWLTRAAAEKPIAIVARKPFQSVTHNAPVGGWKSCL